jgi:uncharacterized membrane protein (DUF106 family)
MLDAINNFLVNNLDWVFGWILYLPRDATLIIVGVLTALVMNYIRKWVTDQAWLRQASEDETRLGELIREAKLRRDRDAVKRHKDVQTAIKMKSMRFEGLALVWALAPFLLVFVWASSRIVCMPTQVGETVEVRADLPKTYIGQAIHLAPEAGLEAVNGWMQTVVAETPPATTSLWDRVDTWLTRKSWLSYVACPAPELQAMAVWQVAVKDAAPHALNIRFAGRTYTQPFVAGQRQYKSPQTVFENAPVLATEVMLTPRRLFGCIGSISWLPFIPPLPAWLVAYFVVAIPCIFGLKSLCKIY